ncbi:MAG: FAD:protein FMN transferase [Firmicutes bacterium]|nr:FAD:protein FMN transferase [Bacillota bacterium]
MALNLKLNQWTVVSPRLYRALTGAYRAYRLTQGLFDPRILRDLERYGYVGAAHGVASLDGGVNPSTRWLDRDPAQSAVRIHVPLDLGGIGKGLGACWAARWIARSTDNLLFTAGGDMVASGSGPEGQGWEIGIEDPNDPDELIAAIRLPHGGIQRAAAPRPVLWVTTTGRLGMTALARPLVFWHASGSPTPIGHGWPRPTDYPHLEKGD